MIFPTLEGLTAQEQEEHEARQREARNGAAPPKQAQARGRPRVATQRVHAFMKPGVQYTSRQLVTACRLSHLELKRMADTGLLCRTGERRSYRYARPG